MGHRANLIVVDAAGCDLYYSHWAASGLDEYLFWGAAEATAFVRRQRSQAEGAELLDETWAEGAAIIDNTRLLLLWFGGDRTCWDVPYRRAHLQMMRELWAGWTVRWASGGIADIAGYVGIDLIAVIGEQTDWPDADPQGIDALLIRHEPDWISSVITCRRAGSVDIFVSDDKVYWLVQAGTRLFEAMRHARSHSNLDWSACSQEFPSGGLHFDWDTRTLGFWFASDFPAAVLRAQLCFPGWTVRCWNDRFEAHVQAVPSLSLPAVDVQELRRDIVKRLLLERTSYADAVPQIVAKLDAQSTVINPFVLRDDVSTPSISTRRALLGKHFPDLVP